MAWLSGYNKRIKLTVDNTNIDDTLSDFPVLIKISNSSGISSIDVTSVFTELGSDANRKKIAVTTSDGETQCYVEIERFDYSNSTAWLWVKVPTVVLGTTTDLYLYYDADQSDNTTYIGDTGDTPAQSVWDINFKLVMHMAQDPNGDIADSIKDSTSNANHGTPGGSMTTADLVDGKVGKAIDFDGLNDNITKSNFLNSAALTVSCIVNVTADDGWFINKKDAASDNQWQLLNHGGSLEVDIHGGVSIVGSVADGATVVNAGHVQIGFTTEGLSGGDLILYREGISNGTPTTLSANMKLGARELCIGKRGWSSAGFVTGDIDEMRISDIVRSPAWIKATYYSNWDELVSFGSEQEMPTHYYYGYITEENVPVSRMVRLYYRDTGELVDTTTSSGSNGYYYLTTSISGEHFIVTLDDELGKDYNALILDKLLPRGIE